MRHDAYLFDLDGTLLDTLPDIAASVNHVRKSYGMPPWTQLRVRAAIGNGVRALLSECLELDESAPADRERLDEALARYRVHHHANLIVDTEPYPGARQCLQELRDRGAAVAVVSNKPEDFVTLLVEHYFAGITHVALGGDSCEQKKPAPDMVLLACQKLGVAAARSAMIGDSPSDLEAGRRADCRECIGVSWGYRDVEELRSGADRILDALSEL